MLSDKEIKILDNKDFKNEISKTQKLMSRKHDELYDLLDLEIERLCKLFNLNINNDDLVEKISDMINDY